jgi:S-adenosylmethionine/arginine decarboxylase-like enzyme
MVQMHVNEIDFSTCTTDEEKLAAIEAFEEARDQETMAFAEQQRATEEMNAMSLASIAANMEYQNMLTLDDVEE